MVDVPNCPSKPERGSRSISISSKIFIDLDDFKTKDEKGYKRLAPGQTVGLLHTGATITANKFKELNGVVTEIEATIDWKPNKPRGYIHWVDERNHIHVELRLYDRLFKSAEPGNLENWLEDINKDSLHIINCYGESSLSVAKPEDKFQFERIGYFCCDTESKKDKIVFNKTVSLKESKEKV